ncbi:MAG: efflux RND transporter periplasmic adaptor subunit [Polyangiales bacterium]
MTDPPAPTQPEVPESDRGPHFELPEAPRPRAAKLLLLAVVSVAVFVGLFALGWVPRVRQKAALAEASAFASAGVPVAHPRRAKLATELKLPATLAAWNDTMLYGRIDGYVRKLNVDIGDTVKAGQLLAEIDAPDAVQQLAQAQAQLTQSKADLRQSKAKLELDKTNAARARALFGHGLMSQQDLDTALATEKVTEAVVGSSEAAVGTNESNVHRLADLLAFARVLAPFDGVISARSINVGALVTSGNGTNQQLFRITQSDPLRVTVSVPQSYAGAIKVDAAATLAVREVRGRTFTGRVSRTSGTIDTATRTLTVEVEVPNHDRALLPGTYGEITFAGLELDPPLTVPVTALSFTAAGTQVAIVGDDGVVRLVSVVIADDYGTELAIASGLRESDLVVVHPDDRTAAGSKVTPVVSSASASR